MDKLWKWIFIICGIVGVCVVFNYKPDIGIISMNYIMNHIWAGILLLAIVVVLAIVIYENSKK